MANEITFRSLKIESPPRKGEITVSGVGGNEQMRPGLINRPGGTGDRLLMFFPGPVTFEDCSFKEPVLRLWENGVGHFYGNAEEEWSHSWIHFHGSAVPTLLADAGVPGEFILSGHDFPFFIPYLSLFYREITGTRQPDERLLKHLLGALFLEIGRYLDHPHPVPEEYLQIRRHIESTPEQSLRLRELARMANRSIPAFTANFRKYFGVSPMQYRLDSRMELARHLLHDRNLSIKEIGMRCGYSDPFQFSRMFRRRYGRSPSECRA